jgi:hypothetical protein
MPEKRQGDHPLNAVIETGGGDASDVMAMVKYRALLSSRKVGAVGTCLHLAYERQRLRGGRDQSPSLKPSYIAVQRERRKEI